MTATVLIGKGQTPSITARVENFSRQSISSDDVDALRKDQSSLTESWSLLTQESIVPFDDDENVFKLSRHIGVRGHIWTWFGCYLHAQFDGARRGGSYIGCGVLQSGDTLVAEQTAQYVTNLLNAMVAASSRDGRVVVPVNDLDLSAIGVKALDLKSGRSASSGLNGGEQRRIYIDQSHLSDQAEFNRSLFRFMADGQDSSAFSEFDELVIGNTARLATAARASRAFEVFTPTEWERRLETLRKQAVSRLPDSKPPEKRSQDGIGQWLFGPAASIDPKYPPPRDDGTAVTDSSRIRRDMTSLECRVLALEESVERTRVDAARSRWRAIDVTLSGFGFGAGLGMAGCLLWIVLHLLQQSTPPRMDERQGAMTSEAVPSDALNNMTAEQPAATTSGGGTSANASCETQTPLRTSPSEEEVQQAKAEYGCLRIRDEQTRQRIKELTRWAKSAGLTLIAQ